MQLSPAVNDTDIFRAAKLLIDQHSEDAPPRAAECADALIEDGGAGSSFPLACWLCTSYAGYAVRDLAVELFK